MAHITIKDRPCGWGKSTEIANSFLPGEKYIAVLPFLSEVDRIIKRAKSQSKFMLLQPDTKNGSKSSCVKMHVENGTSLACTHALLYRLGTLATEKAMGPEIESMEIAGFSVQFPTENSLLHEYNFIIDEVVNPFEVENGTQPRDFEKDYVGLGMAVVDPVTGKVEPTALWDQRYSEGSKTFKPSLYEKAKSGALYVVESKLFISTIPSELLLKSKSVTIYTYLSGGTVLLQFLKQLQSSLKGTQDEFTLEVDKLPEAEERAWREDVQSALTIKSIPALEPFDWSHSGQINTFVRRNVNRSGRQAGNALKKFYGKELSGISKSNVLLTCARDLWYSSAPGRKPMSGPLSEHARLFGHPCRIDDGTQGLKKWDTTGVRWIGNTTRGLNDYITCTHAVYLYGQHPNPQLLQFLNIPSKSKEGRDFSDAYALSEMVQWLFRCCIRDGGMNGCNPFAKPRSQATVYVPCARMRALLTNWLATGEVSSVNQEVSTTIRRTPSPRRVAT